VILVAKTKEQLHHMPKKFQTETSIHSAASPDAAVQKLPHNGVGPPLEYGRFSDVKAQFSITRSTCYELIWAGKIKSCVVKRKGARHGIRLIDMASVRDFLRSNTR